MLIRNFACRMRRNTRDVYWLQVINSCHTSENTIKNFVDIMPQFYANNSSSSSSLESGSKNGTNDSKIENVMRSSYLNRGTTMSQSLRNSLKLTGLMPVAVENLDLQKKRALQQLRSKPTDLEKYLFLAWLRNTNVRLFYQIVIEELEEITPLIYTPTVGTACLEYSHIYPFLAPPGVPDGLYLSINDSLSNLKQIIKNYQPYPFDESFTPQIAVITDGSRILGLGDLGVNGMGIPVGKLQLYVAGAGIDPRRTLPITLDLGTDSEKNLNDELYLGLRRKRVNDEQFYSFLDAVIESLIEVYPQLLIQFEDFSSEHAFELLAKYRNNIFCFNDDIQGTGAVVLSGFINAVNLVKKEIPPTHHRLLFFGAGSAGVGVAKQLLEFFTIEHGMSEKDAKKLVWFVDTKGLITLDRGDKLAKHKVYFARSDNNGKQYKSLLEVIDYVKPTALIGLSTTGGVFNDDVLRRMSELNKRPIIFPLSNPMVNAECTFENAMRITKNKAIFASGTAFPPHVDQETGKVYYPGQGNNMYIFPGLGLGAILARSKIITDRQIYASASALATSLTFEETSQNLLYPAIQRIRQVSSEVAAAVIVEAVDEGLARNPKVIELVKKDYIKEMKLRKGEKWEKLIKFVDSNMWDPKNAKFFEIDENLTSTSGKIIELVKKDYIKEMKLRKGEKWEKLIKFVDSNMWDPKNAKFFEIDENLTSTSGKKFQRAFLQRPQEFKCFQGPSRNNDFLNLIFGKYPSFLIIFEKNLKTRPLWWVEDTDDLCKDPSGILRNDLEKSTGFGKFIDTRNSEFQYPPAVEELINKNRQYYEYLYQFRIKVLSHSPPVITTSYFTF
ncbi:hypothetical protein Glove_707g62 [Diversispora epigaea]|uniref:Malic enzyme n=1 Tax=Diversispora epigaea TaxID=1348612 RepID=A0A397G1N6_9GLOM|nr:hypothetical protein Glove_707g62 [Diversispora epigaea]